MSAKKTPIAICYDFDGTLIEGNMQENSFIPAVGSRKEIFWKEVRDLAKANDMDSICAYMKTMIDKAQDQRVSITKQKLKEHGEELKFYPGVEGWFDLIKQHVQGKSLTLQHFIISSGIDDMIRGCKISKEFEHIFASGFLYDENQVPQFIARTVNYTTKVQYLFRVNKGIHNSWNDVGINEYTPIEKRPVPFPRMIYIGDGETDVPTMKMINYQGGYSIAVYPPKNNGRRTKDQISKEQSARDLVVHDRAQFVVPADYSANEPLHKVIIALIDRIANEIQTSMNINASFPNSIPNPEKPRVKEK